MNVQSFLSPPVLNKWSWGFMFDQKKNYTQVLVFNDSLALPLEYHSILLLENLSGSVATVDDDISAGGIRASVAGEVDICTLQLSSLGVTSHGNHRVP